MMENKWIPCCKKLPQTTGYYLVTQAFGDLLAVGLNWYDADNEWWQTEIINADTDKDECNLAWMPLPQPFQCEDEEGCGR